jgi:acyl carrier protein
VDDLKQIIATTLQIPAAEVTDDASPDSLSQWDSLAHLNLVMAIEKHFGVKFTLDEIVELRDLPTIRGLIQKKKGA